MKEINEQALAEVHILLGEGAHKKVASQLWWQIDEPVEWQVHEQVYLPIHQIINPSR